MMWVLADASAPGRHPDRAAALAWLERSGAARNAWRSATSATSTLRWHDIRATESKAAWGSASSRLRRPEARGWLLAHRRRV